MGQVQTSFVKFARGIRGSQRAKIFKKRNKNTCLTDHYPQSCLHDNGLLKIEKSLSLDFQRLAIYKNTRSSLLVNIRAAKGVCPQPTFFFFTNRTCNKWNRLNRRTLLFHQSSFHTTQNRTLALNDVIRRGATVQPLMPNTSLQYVAFKTPKMQHQKCWMAALPAKWKATYYRGANSEWDELLFYVNQPCAF